MQKLQISIESTGFLQSVKVVKYNLNLKRAQNRWNAQIPNTTESREMLIKVNGGVLIHCTKGKKLGISLTLHLWLWRYETQGSLHSFFCWFCESSFQSLNTLRDDIYHYWNYRPQSVVQNCCQQCKIVAGSAKYLPAV